MTLLYCLLIVGWVREEKISISPASAAESRAHLSIDGVNRGPDERLVEDDSPYLSQASSKPSWRARDCRRMP
jgi:hypothetical protein